MNERNEIDVIGEKDAEWADSYQKELSRGVTRGGSADDAGAGAGALEVWPSLPYEEWRETYETLTKRLNARTPI